MTVVRVVVLFGLGVCVAVGCAGKSAAVRWAAHAEPGDQQLPIKEVGDVVDVYQSVLGDSESVSIEQVSRTVVMLRTSAGASYPVTLQPDGTLAIPGHQGARLIRRSCRVFLQITWTPNRWALYRATPDAEAAPSKEGC
jgi:hypothetical protein